MRPYTDPPTAISEAEQQNKYPYDVACPAQGCSDSLPPGTIGPAAACSTATSRAACAGLGRCTWTQSLYEDDAGTCTPGSALHSDKFLSVNRFVHKQGVVPVNASSDAAATTKDFYFDPATELCIDPTTYATQVSATKVSKNDAIVQAAAAASKDCL